MIKRYYRSLRGERMQLIDDYKAGCWVHAEAPTPEEVAELVERYDLTPGHLEDALDEDEMPRLETEGDQTYIFVRFAHRDTEGEFESMPLLIIITKSATISVCPVRFPAMDALVNGKTSFATTQKAKLVLLILQKITEQYDTLITKTSKKIKAVRSRLRQHSITNQDFVDFVVIEDELNEFLISLLPTNATLRRLLLGHHLKMFDEDQDLAEDLLLSNEQSVEACNSNIKSIVGVRDAHSSISSNSLNRTMKILTVATLGVAIPNSFFGLYSMNVTTPFQHSAFAFWIIMVTTIITTAIVFVIGRRKGVF